MQRTLAPNINPNTFNDAMKSHSSITESLSQVPLSVFEHSPIFKQTPKSVPAEHVLWFKLVDFVEINLSLGLSLDGYWIRGRTVEVRNHSVHKVDVGRGLVLIYPCLLLNKSFFLSKLLRAIENFNLPAELQNTFPIDALISQALTGMSNYWVKKALNWISLELLTPNIQASLHYVASLSKNPQSLKNKASRLLANHYRIALEKQRQIFSPFARHEIRQYYEAVLAQASMDQQRSTEAKVFALQETFCAFSSKYVFLCFCEIVALSILECVKIAIACRYSSSQDFYFVSHTIGASSCRKHVVMVQLQVWREIVTEKSHCLSIGCSDLFLKGVCDSLDRGWINKECLGMFDSLIERIVHHIEVDALPPDSNWIWYS